MNDYPRRKTDIDREPISGVTQNTDPALGVYEDDKPVTRDVRSGSSNLWITLLIIVVLAALVILALQYLV